MTPDTIDATEAETMVLGSMMMSRNACGDTLDIVTAADFGAARHAVIFDTIAGLHQSGNPTEPTAVLAALGGDLARVGGAPYLHTLYSAPTTPANAAHYARIVADTGTRRRLTETGIRITQLGHASDGIPAADLVETARAEIDACIRARADIALVGDRIDASLDSLEQPPTTIPTPWADLNHIIRGWRPGALYVIGARPGVGKSIAAVQAAIDLSSHGYVAFASLEMPERELHMRIIAAIANVPLYRLDDHALTGDDWTKIANVRQSLDALRISIDDRGRITPTDIRSHARTLARRGTLTGIVVDYLQLMGGTPADARRPRHEVVAGISRSLKLMAKEFDVPVIALSQLNRASEGRQDKRPTLADLRESGAVEQDSDVVLLLHEHEKDETALDMLVAKNRHGARGPVNLKRLGWYSRLEPRQWTPADALERVS